MDCFLAGGDPGVEATGYLRGENYLPELDLNSNGFSNTGNDGKFSREEHTGHSEPSIFLQIRARVGLNSRRSCDGSFASTHDRPRTKVISVVHFLKANSHKNSAKYSLGPFLDLFALGLRILSAQSHLIVNGRPLLDKARTAGSLPVPGRVDTGHPEPNHVRAVGNRISLRFR